MSQRTSGVNSRREAAEDRVQQTTASAQTGIRQLADSPVAALGAYSGLKQKEQQAIADIGQQYEGIRDEAIMGQARTEEMGAGYSDKESYYNDMYKKMVRANMGANKMSGGANQMWQGIEGVAGTALDYAGTKYLGDIYDQNKSLQSGGGFDPADEGAVDPPQPVEDWMKSPF
jgi:hypothetical protein